MKVLIASLPTSARSATPRFTTGTLGEAMINPHERLSYYLAWARTYLKRGGALENSARGVWSLTDTGAAISTYEETRAIYDKVGREERERARLKRLAAKQTPELHEKVEQPQDDEGPEGEENWKSSLLAVLGNMDPSAFERLSQRLLREAGFIKVEVRGKSGDGGIDGVGVLRMNLVSFQVYFQCSAGSVETGPTSAATSAHPPLGVPRGSGAGGRRTRSSGILA
jgi:restriction endonuclease Mrr